MNSEQNKSVNTPGSSTQGSGFITPDTDTQAPSGDYLSAEADLNDSRSDQENVDIPVPETSRQASGGNVVDRQLGSISQTPG